MKAALEAPRPRRPNVSFAAFERILPEFPWNWHHHPEIELTWIRKGSGHRRVGDHAAEYGPGDLVLIGPNLPHTWFSHPEKRKPSPTAHRAVVVQFLPHVFPEALRALPEFAPAATLLARAGRGLRFSHEIARRIGPLLVALPRKEGAEAWTGMIGILARLAEEESRRPAETLAGESYRHHRSHRFHSRIERVMTHLEKHCRDELPLREAARQAGMNPASFSRFFRKMTGRTFVDQRNAYRVREACRLLAETDLPIVQIAYEAGFGNLSHFNRIFREDRRLTPRRYRGIAQGQA